MDIERNKTTVRRVFEEGFWQGRLAVVDECLAFDAVDHSTQAEHQCFAGTVFGGELLALGYRRLAGGDVGVLRPRCGRRPWRRRRGR